MSAFSLTLKTFNYIDFLHSLPSSILPPTQEVIVDLKQVSYKDGGRVDTRWNYKKLVKIS